MLCAVIAVSIGSLTSSGAADPLSEPAAVTAAPDICRSAREAVPFYRNRTWYWQELRAGRLADRTPIVRGKSCHWSRYAAGEWKARVRAAFHTYHRWWRYQYDWRSWLPPVWKAIIQCETHSNFQHNSGTYQGAFGFHRSSWDAFRLPGYPSEAYEATPRQQYEVALAIWRRYGFSGWGCA